MSITCSIYRWAFGLAFYQMPAVSTISCDVSGLVKSLRSGFRLLAVAGSETIFEKPPRNPIYRPYGEMVGCPYSVARDGKLGSGSCRGSLGRQKSSCFFGVSYLHRRQYNQC